MVAFFPSVTLTHSLSQWIPLSWKVIFGAFSSPGLWTFSLDLVRLPVWVIALLLAWCWMDDHFMDAPLLFQQVHDVRVKHHELWVNKMFHICSLEEVITVGLGAATCLPAMFTLGWTYRWKKSADVGAHMAQNGNASQTIVETSRTNSFTVGWKPLWRRGASFFFFGLCSLWHQHTSLLPTDFTQFSL